MNTLKGVNLGGWLVVEKWITPSLFSGTSAKNEFELSKTKQGKKRLSKHHKEFITETDIKWLKGQGVDILRVPFGHWIFGDDKRYVGAIDHLDWLVETSLSYGLKVLLDLHAAPGAQNRAAHSGSGNTVSDKHSTKWLNNNSKQEQTIVVLLKIAERYRDFPNIWGIELLNEPTVDLLGVKLARFYRRAYRSLIKVARPGTRIVFSDAYAPLRLTNALWLSSKRDFPAIIDCHIYQVFGQSNKHGNFDLHLRRIKWIKLVLNFLRLQQPVIVGEWSAMLPMSTTQNQTKAYVEAQQRAFNQTLAHFYWTYKTDSEGRWNFRDQAKKELIQ